MGVQTLLAGGDPDRLAQASLANAAVDAGDALALSGALAAGEDGIRGAALRGIAGALPAAAAGLWVAWRLGALPAKRPGAYAVSSARPGSRPASASASRRSR